MIIIVIIKTYNLFAVNAEVIVTCNRRSDLWTFRSTEVVTRRTEGCRKRSRGTNDLFYIDRAVIREVKSRKKN